MADTTKDRLVSLHKSGAKLSQAWLTFASPQLKEEWNELHGKSAVGALQDGIQAAAAMEGDQVAKITTAFAGNQKILGGRSALKRKLKTNVLTYIAQGHLHAYAFENPRLLSSIPVAIPKAAWKGKCDWTRGRLSCDGLEFIDVRLTTNRIRNEILERGNVDRTPARKIGRPSVANEIRAAIQALNEAGEIDPKASQKSHFPKAMRWLELNRPDLKPSPGSISYETFRKQFSPLFNELKKNQKQ